MNGADEAFFAHLRASLEAMTTDVGPVVTCVGLTDCRPRLSTVIRVVTGRGRPCCVTSSRG